MKTLLSLFIAITVNTHAAVTFEWVTVGDANNANDSTGYGGVGYEYKIMKYEVTNAQYAEFLNAVDSVGTNPNALYNGNMSSDTAGGIRFAGAAAAAGSKYEVKSNMGDKPVNYVSFIDAMRFSNWLNNGQGSGGTESGVYDMTQNPSTVIHASNATVWIPTENEWYKAAFYQPASEGGPTDSYWLYPTRSDTAPTATSPTATPNTVNRNYAVGNVTNVGAYSNSSTYYGTFDQAGNVWEWNEAIVVGGLRGLRGASFASNNSDSALDRGYNTPLQEYNMFGFRLASPVPEPSRVMLLLAGVCGLALRRRRLPFAV